MATVAEMAQWFRKAFNETQSQMLITDNPTNRGGAPRAAAPGSPPWRRPAWSAVVLLAVLAGTLVWGLFGPEPAIVVSPRTTFVTAPLAADGLPDYEAAALAMGGPAPAAENNGAVDLLQVMWPMGIEAADLAAGCAALGISITPPARPLPDPTKSADVGAEFQEMFDASSDRPWTGDEMPAVEAWLLDQAAHLDRLVAAADRPQFWLPEAALIDGRPGQLNAGSLEFRWMRTLHKVLMSRANWHLGAGRHEAAWRDRRAGLLLSRRYAATVRGMWRSVVDLMNAAMEKGMTQWAARHLLGSPATPADVIATIRRDLDALGPPPGPEAGLDAERRVAVDFLVWIARRESGGRAARETAIAKIDVGLFGRQVVLDAEPWARSALRTSLDWNVALERINDLHDRHASAARLPTHAERRVALHRLDTEVRNGPAAAPATASSRFLAAIHWAWSRGQRSRLVGDAVGRLLASGSSEGYLATLAERDAMLDMLRTAAALAAWRIDRPAGDPPYPEQLEDLVPACLDRVPLDPFTAAPLVYERRGDGYLLVSAGRDGVHDGGNDESGSLVGGEWQAEPAVAAADYDDIFGVRTRPRTFDLVIRIPWADHPLKTPPPPPTSTP